MGNEIIKSSKIPLILIGDILSSNPNPENNFLKSDKMM
jgi:hypothetical protein